VLKVLNFSTVGYFGSSLTMLPNDVLNQAHISIQRCGWDFITSYNFVIQ